MSNAVITAYTFNSPQTVTIGNVAGTSYFFYNNADSSEIESPSGYFTAGTLTPDQVGTPAWTFDTGSVIGAAALKNFTNQSSINVSSAPPFMGVFLGPTFDLIGPYNPDALVITLDSNGTGGTNSISSSVDNWQWTLSTTGNVRTLSISTVALPTVNLFLLWQTSITDDTTDPTIQVTGLTDGGSTSRAYLYSIQSGTNGPAPACFAGTTEVLVEGDRFVPLRELGGHARLWVEDGQGHEELVEATILRAVSFPSPESWGVKLAKGCLGADMPKRDITVSKHHLLLLPTDVANAISKPCDEWVCRSCAARGEHDVTCDTCCPVDIPRGMSCVLAHDIRRNIGERVISNDWFHIRLPEGKDRMVVRVDKDICSETYRTPLDEALKQGWKLATKQ